MKKAVENISVYSGGVIKHREISSLHSLFDSSLKFAETAGTDDFSDFYILPGFVDVHVHLREPGFSYKETVASGTLAAAHGGYTSVCSMPNINPPPDCLQALKEQLAIIERDALINVFPYGTITKMRKGCGELADYESMKEYVIGFSDDGTGVSEDEIMLQAMRGVKKTGKLIAAHCEDLSLVNGGVIHQGEFARRYGFRGIPSASEYEQIRRDLKLVSKTDCRYHVCHVSAKESVALLREAKKAGLPVTFETAPHYLTLTENDLKDEGRYKMNPPLRKEADRYALLEAAADGTLDMIATDHAPHSAEEKAKGLNQSAMGITGLEAAFPVMYTELVKKGVITLERLMALMADNPRRIFGIKDNEEQNFSIWNLNKEYVIDTDEFKSKGKSTPFAGRTVYGENIMTVFGGTKVWTRKK